MVDGKYHSGRGHPLVKSKTSAVGFVLGPHPKGSRPPSLITQYKQNPPSRNSVLSLLPLHFHDLNASHRILLLVPRDKGKVTGFCSEFIANSNSCAGRCLPFPSKDPLRDPGCGIKLTILQRQRLIHHSSPMFSAQNISFFFVSSTLPPERTRCTHYAGPYR